MLRFDYSRAKAQVRELRAIADDMERNKALANAVDKLKSSWEGRVSNNFQQKCAQLADLVKKEVTNIRNIANALEKSANEIAEAERRAQEALNTDTVRNI